jgi:hypothetical protein
MLTPWDLPHRQLPISRSIGAAPRVVDPPVARPERPRDNPATHFFAEQLQPANDDEGDPFFGLIVALGIMGFGTLAIGCVAYLWGGL